MKQEVADSNENEKKNRFFLKKNYFYTCKCSNGFNKA
tara:strand:+ start:1296 stop:1406 length:111 start_codon:yes stop_codon:yes gene_type:complete